MHPSSWQRYIQYTDASRDLIVPGTKEATLNFCVEHFIFIANQAIKDHDMFTVALSGGSTPNAIYRRLAMSSIIPKIDWSKVLLFWSDERAVPPDDPESNFGMAMQAGLKDLPIPPDHIFRMKAESDIEKNAANYEKLIQTMIPQSQFDLVMLGMGDDGHTASLFPNSEGLRVTDKLVIANFIPKKNTWRMSLTFECINKAKNISVYVIGEKKARMLSQVLINNSEDIEYPAQKAGTPNHRALWIADDSAAAEVINTI